MEMRPDPAFTALAHHHEDRDPYAMSKYRVTLRWLRRYSADVAQPILNVGAGSGEFARQAAHYGFRTVNLEPDPQAADLAEQRLGPGSVLRCQLADLPAHPTWATVVMHDVLEHIENDRESIRSLANLTQGHSNALCVLSVPAWPALFGLHDELLGHFRRYTPRALRGRFGEYFDVLGMRQFGLVGIPAALWYSRIRRRPYPLEGGGAARTLFTYMCRVEEHVNVGLGSSLLVIGRPKPT